MNFAFSEEQETLREFVRQFLENYSPETTVRELMETDTGYDAETWSMMAEQLGLQSLIIPEEHGGQGFGYVELVVVLEEQVSLVSLRFLKLSNLIPETLRSLVLRLLRHPNLLP